VTFAADETLVVPVSVVERCKLRRCWSFPPNKRRPLAVYLMQ